MKDPKARGIAAGICGDSPVKLLLDSSIEQLSRGQVLTSPRSKAERSVALRHFLSTRSRMVAARIRRLLSSNPIP